MFVCRGGFNKQYHIVGDEALTFYQLFNFLNILLQEALVEKEVVMKKAPFSPTGLFSERKVSLT
jgi:hypothetical protein